MTDYYNILSLSLLLMVTELYAATRDGICNCSTTSLRNDYETVEVVVELNSSSNHSELEGEVPIACGTSHTATCYCQGNVYVGHGELKNDIGKWLKVNSNFLEVKVQQNVKKLTEMLDALNSTEFYCKENSSVAIFKRIKLIIQYPQILLYSNTAVGPPHVLYKHQLKLTCPLVPYSANEGYYYSWDLDGRVGIHLEIVELNEIHLEKQCFTCTLVVGNTSRSANLCEEPFYYKIEVNCENAEDAKLYLTSNAVQMHQSGSVVTLNITWVRLKNPRVQWYDPNDRQLTFKSYSNSILCEGSTSLTIQNFTHEDVGNYTCIVTSRVNTKIFHKKTVRLQLMKLVQVNNQILMEESKITVIGVSIGLSVAFVVMVTVTVSAICYMKYRRKKLSDKSYSEMDLPVMSEEYQFDVFLSFHDNEREFVEQHILIPLEERGFRCCFHLRDFVPGRSIWDNITTSMINSRIAILVLSKSYRYSKFCSYEMRLAVERVCETNTRYLLPVAWNAENIPKEIKKLTFTQVVGGSEEDIHIKLSSIIGNPVGGHQE